MNYQKQLKDVRWLVLKDRIMERDGDQCTQCVEWQNLEVHHLRYGKTAWDVDDSDLVTLCHRCHATIHGKKPTKPRRRWPRPAVTDGAPERIREFVEARIELRAAGMLQENESARLAVVICPFCTKEAAVLKEPHYRNAYEPRFYCGNCEGGDYEALLDWLTEDREWRLSQTNEEAQECL